MWLHDARVGDVIRIGETTMTVLAINRDPHLGFLRVKLGFTAPPSVRIKRAELVDRK